MEGNLSLTSGVRQFLVELFSGVSWCIPLSCKVQLACSYSRLSADEFCHLLERRRRSHSNLPAALSHPVF